MPKTTFKERQNSRSFPRLTLHPLFFAVGIWYAFTGELFLFLLSCIVALQHECAHAFAAAKLGYKLNRIVLMPYGAVIDGDLDGISFRDEAYVALCGPLCNLLTAGFFGALWWFFPDTYAYTDIAFYSSLAIALVNILPAYPLDGGRILQACLFSAFSNKESKPLAAQRRANSVCKAVTVVFSLIFFACFLLTRGKNVSLLLFGVFLFFGVVGNKNTHTVYEKLDFSIKTSLKKGVQIRYVAVLDSRPVKDVLPFLERGSYLVLRVYDENERHLFDLPQNEFSEWFLRAKTPYTTLKELFVTKKEYTYS